MAKSKSVRKRDRARARGASGATRRASSSTPAAVKPTPRAARPASQGAQRGGAGGTGGVRFRETSGRDWRRTLLYVVLFLGSVVVALTFIEPRRGPVPAVLLVLVSLWTLVAWHNKAYAYRCANCRRVFQVPTIVNFLSFQGVGRRPDGTYRGWKALTCPYCHQRTKATVVSKVEMTRKPRGGSPGSDAQLLQ